MYTIWLYGLPCSGKTTIAKKLTKNINEHKTTVHLDGDIVRKTICNDLSFTKEDRFINITRIAYTAQLLNNQGIICVCSFVTPLESYREQVRDLIDNVSIVHVECPLEVCKRRDVKGMYKKALNGEIEGFTGIDGPFETGGTNDMSVLTHIQTVDECCNVVNMNLNIYPLNFEV